MSRPSSEPAAGEAAALRSGSGAGAQDAAPVPMSRGARTGWSVGRFLRARIGAQSLHLELLQGRGNPRPLVCLVQPYAGDAQRSQPTDLLPAIAALEPALAALQEKLEGDGSRPLRGLVCDLIIDDSWMLYDIVRADLRGLSPRAADALIGASLADVAGVSASELISRWQPQGKSPYTLACGLPAGALPALQQALAAHRLVTGAVEGEFVFEFNRHRDRLDPGCAVIAVVREAGAQLAVLVDGILTSMSFEFGVDNARELELRGRGLLRIAGFGGGASIRFYAMTPPQWKAPEPWVCLPMAA